MKKITLISFLLPFSLFAQEDKSADFILKPYVGYSNSFQFGERINSYDEKKSRKDITFGVLAEIAFNEHIAAVTGIQYQRMGSTLIDYPILPYYNGMHDKEELDYISVPLLMKYKFGSNKNWSISGGFVLSRLLSAKNNDEDISHVINYGQISGSLGFGYIYPLNDRLSLSIDQQNTVGLVQNGANNNGYVGYYSPTIYKRYNFYSSLNFGLQIKL